MGISGNLRTMALPEILQWISLGRKTGTLQLERRSIQKKIFFRDGSIVSSWSNDPRESLGQFLMRDRRVTEEQLFKALLRQEEQGRLLGSILIGDGALTEAHLRQSLKTKAEETIYDLFLWPEGDFGFREGELPENVAVLVEMPVTEIVMEGIRRVDEWQRIRAVFPTTATTFKVAGPPGADAAERDVLQRAGQGKSLAQIALETHRSEFDTAALLHDLHGRGLVSVDQPGEALPETDTVAAIGTLLATARQRMQERRYDAALRTYEDVLVLDRLNQNAKKGLIAAVTARERERAVRRIPLAKVPVMIMSYADLTKEKFDPHEGFVLSRVNGQWDVQSILKLCPMSEEEALLIFARLLDRKVIELR